jgi:MoaA/NifB/PqqE/SkfB family radical SAM enzyme
MLKRSLLLEHCEEELEELHLELTYACNLKCRMCDIWNKSKREPKIARQEG